MPARILHIIKARKTALMLGVLLTAAIVGDVAYYFAVCRPVAGEAAGLKARLTQLQKMNRETADAIGSYERFIEGRKSLDEFKSRLPSRSEYADVIRQVYTLAKKDGMKGKSFGAQTNAVRQVGGLEELSFSMPVSGSYRGVRKFIYDVESSELLLNINRLGLAGGDDGEITLTIAISTYMRS